MHDAPESKVQEWLDRQPDTSIWTTSVTVFEVEFGLFVMPAGRRKAALTVGFERILEEIDHRIAEFDEEAAREAGKLAGARQKLGRVGELRDTMIAGIVLARHATLATRNVAHFSDVPSPIVNPWAA